MSVDSPKRETEKSGSVSQSTTASVDTHATIPNRKDFGVLPIPAHLRHDPSRPHTFGWALNVAFGFATIFIVSNLYYCQPILVPLSESFRVTYNEVSIIPTLVQAGYAVGILFITPLGDLTRRRPLILALQTVSTSLTIGLAVTSSVYVFEILSFFIGVSSVTSQILIPLAADLAAPERRGRAVSIVLSGLLLGILTSRVLSGLITEYTSWRVVYYFALGMQVLVLIGSFFTLPDYPSKTHEKELNYWGILRSMAGFLVTEPILVQACLISIAISACFSSFWVTLTFLLSDPPYEYTTLVIGLFGLVGVAGVLLGPLLGYAVDKMYPWFASLISILISGAFLSIQLAAGGIHVSAPILAAFGFDLARQSLAVSLSTAIFALRPEARSRMNAINVLSFFIGQVIGTSVGTSVFLKYGWRAAAGLNVAWVGFQIVVLLLRGPHVAQHKWFGYQGGMAWKIPRLETNAEEATEKLGDRERSEKHVDDRTKAPET